MLLITPHQGTTYLTEVLDGQLVFLREIKADYRLWHAYRDGLVYMDWDTGFLQFAARDGAATGQGWTLPPQSMLRRESICLALAGNRAYISGTFGRDDEPGLLSCSLDTSQSEWLDYYPDKLGHRKQIDSLIVSEKRLIAVDDILVPKYLFFIDNAEEIPSQVNVIQIPVNGTYERILHATQFRNQLAVLSKTINHGVSGTHLSLYDLIGFEPRAHFSVNAALDSSEDATNRIELEVASAFGSLLIGGALHSKPLNFAAAADHMVVACGGAGIVILNPDNFARREKSADHGNQFILRSAACRLSINQLPLHQLEVGSQTAKPEMVTDVIGAGTQGCVIVLRLSDNSYESILLGSNFLKAMF